MRGFGKIILFGEHAVVYGFPSLAAGLTKGIYGEVKEKQGEECSLSVPLWGLEVRESEESQLGKALRTITKSIPLSRHCHIHLIPEIPCKAGLGSSAAMAVAIIKTLVEWKKLDWPLEKINELALESECVFHGTPSGIDNTVATYGGLCYLSDAQRFSPPACATKHLKLKKLTASFLPSLPHAFSFVIINTRKERETKKLVDHVREEKLKNPEQMESLFSEIGTFAWEGYTCMLEQQNEKLGRLMQRNHELLFSLGISSPELEKAASCAYKAGALGAKLTGAGGGGCLIAFAPGKEDAILLESEKQGFTGFIAQIM